MKARIGIGDAAMGLATVELVMDIEEEFEVELPFERGIILQRLGDIHHFIVSSIRKRGEPANPDEIWKRLVKLVKKHTWLRESEITPDSDIYKDLGLN